MKESCSFRKVAFLVFKIKDDGQSPERNLLIMNKNCFLPYIYPSETLRMLEDAYGKAAV
jgi:hypothetical protein